MAPVRAGGGSRSGSGDALVSAAVPSPASDIWCVLAST